MFKELDESPGVEFVPGALTPQMPGRRVLTITQALPAAVSLQDGSPHASVRKSEGRLTPELSRRPTGALAARGLLVRTVAVGAVLAGRLGRARTVTAA